MEKAFAEIRHKKQEKACFVCKAANQIAQAVCTASIILIVWQVNIWTIGQEEFRNNGISITELIYIKRNIDSLFQEFINN